MSSTTQFVITVFLMPGKIGDSLKIVKSVEVVCRLVNELNCAPQDVNESQASVFPSSQRRGGRDNKKDIAKLFLRRSGRGGQTGFYRRLQVLLKP